MLAHLGPKLIPWHKRASPAFYITRELPPFLEKDEPTSSLASISAGTAATETTAAKAVKAVRIYPAENIVNS